jgi:alpha-D-ribose 1-methylphosphonate 5-triphosphate synthase subunit PhnH
MTSAAPAALLPGFADPVFDTQAVFRAALDAMSYPGRTQSIPASLQTPEPLGIAAGSLALSLFDLNTPVWLDATLSTDAVVGYLRFHCGCPIVSVKADAKFALISAAHLPTLDKFDIGEDRYPDRSATLIIAVPSLTDGPATTWVGPGINGSITANIAGLRTDFWNQWTDNAELYPQGIDVVFTCGEHLIGLPRTITVEA